MGLGVTNKSSRLDYIREKRAGFKCVKENICRSLIIIT